jgi:hypothetical protein
MCCLLHFVKIIGITSLHVMNCCFLIKQYVSHGFISDSCHNNWHVSGIFTSSDAITWTRQLEDCSSLNGTAYWWRYVKFHEQEAHSLLGPLIIFFILFFFKFKNLLNTSKYSYLISLTFKTLSCSF